MYSMSGTKTAEWVHFTNHLSVVTVNLIFMIFMYVDTQESRLWPVNDALTETGKVFAVAMKNNSGSGKGVLFLPLCSGQRCSTIQAWRAPSPGPPATQLCC